MSETEFKRKRLYGRKSGRPLRIERQTAYDDLMPMKSITHDFLSENANQDPQGLFQSPKSSIWMEIGFGNGDHLYDLMSRHHDVGFMGVEPYLNGMAHFLKLAQDTDAEYRVLQDDALLLVRSLKEDCLERLYILNPDPWPKARHHKRRIVNPENLDQYARILKSGGRLIMTTDVEELAEWMRDHALNHPDFMWEEKSCENWEIPPAGWVETRYEKKGKAAGRTQRYMIFIRK
jgi:tRNA (guanine-N7-)-methyltransferase